MPIKIQEHIIATRAEQLTYLRTIRIKLGFKALNQALIVCDYGMLDIVEMAYVMDESTAAIRKTEAKAINKLKLPQNGQRLKKYLKESIDFESTL